MAPAVWGNRLEVSRSASSNGGSIILREAGVERGAAEARLHRREDSEPDEGGVWLKRRCGKMRKRHLKQTK